MIEKNYQPAEIEGRISRAWEDAGAFKAGRPERRDAKPFTIVIPPPNVTGSLHMGHALNNTLQDILCRFERMRGRDVLWQPGTDHAGIATQMVVERQLQERQEPGRRDMGRAKFLERVWQWKAESGGVIVNQLKRLGASCDWSRERFTMGDGSPDDQMVRAVTKAFVELYNTKGPDGRNLIYKDKRLVNWDPKLLTAISDLEVQQIECTGSFKWTRGGEEPLDVVKLGKVLDRNPNGHLYYFKYPIEGVVFNPDDASTHITVATTRPETMLGDTAVAVHPDNEKLKHLIDKFVILPLVGRRIPIIGDDYADPEKGTGAVKITPAHDFNDFEVGKRHGLQPISIFNADGTLSLFGNFLFKSNIVDAFINQVDQTISDLDGDDRFVARQRVVLALNKLHLLMKIEPHTHAVPYGDRSGVVIEPYLTDQWYVDAKTLAAPAIAAVRNGKTSFVPKNWEKTYFEWMDNIQPWCISRQLWWGHQIPAWYGFKIDSDRVVLLGSSNQFKPIFENFVASTEAEALELARKYYGVNDISVVANDIEAIDKIDHAGGTKFAVWRDEDVLDTWFSSALWPFSTLGWPDSDVDVKRYYPTNVLVTGFDIIFFWVARMMMIGIHFMQKERPDAPLNEVVPFPEIYIHALVRDEKGAKMSKSKGNVIDPLGIIDDYGADALRFTLAAMAAQGRDIKLSTQRVEGYRNFATKLWNASRFAEMNGCTLPQNFDPSQAKETLNKWIAHETARAAREVTEAVEAYRFNDAAGIVYRFVWNVYCDWYLELAKPVMMGPDSPAKTETQAMVAWARDEIVKLLHPFMPFITEELWAVTVEGGKPRDSLLALAQWPSYKDLADDAAENEIGWVIDLVTSIRSMRSEMNVPVATLFPLVLVGASADIKSRAERWSDVLKRLARLGEISFADRAPDGSVQLLIRGEVAALPLKGVIDLAAEKIRLDKELSRANDDIKRVDAKLGNEKFVANAPEEVIDEQREKRDEAEARKLKILEALDRLKSAA